MIQNNYIFSGYIGKQVHLEICLPSYTSLGKLPYFHFSLGISIEHYKGSKVTPIVPDSLTLRLDLIIGWVKITYYKK